MPVYLLYDDNTTSNATNVQQTGHGIARTKNTQGSPISSGSLHSLHLKSIYLVHNLAALNGIFLTIIVYGSVVIELNLPLTIPRSVLVGSQELDTYSNT